MYLLTISVCFCFGVTRSNSKLTRVRSFCSWTVNSPKLLHNKTNKILIILKHLNALQLFYILFIFLLFILFDLYLHSSLYSLKGNESHYKMKETIKKRIKSDCPLSESSNILNITVNGEILKAYQDMCDVFRGSHIIW